MNLASRHSNGPLAHVSPASVALPQAVAPAPETPPLMKLHRRLQGKYLWAILLALAGAVTGGIWGYSQRRPSYESTAMIRIQPVLPHILYQTDHSGILPMYEQYFNTQLKMIVSDHVLTLAVQQPEWQALNRGWNPGVQAAFIKGLSVQNPPGTELIDISFNDMTPYAAAAGVHSVLAAYLKVYNEQEEAFESERMKILATHRDDLQEQLAKINTQITDIANRYGTDSLDLLSDAKFKRLDHLETMLEEVRWMLAAAEPDKEGRTSVSPVRQLTVDEIAKEDATTADYLKRKSLMLAQLQAMKIHYKDTHPLVVELFKQINALDQTIEQHAQIYRQAQPADAVQRPWEMDGIPPVVTLTQLRERENRLKNLYQTAESDAIKMGRDSLELRRFHDEATDIEQRLNTTRGRIEQLNVEAAVAGRLQVISTGEVPLQPSKDPRLKWAVVGSGAGGMAGFLAMALLAVLDPRMRRVEHLDHRTYNLPVLGILPNLREDLSDPQETAVAVHCIHQLRARLQLGADGSARNVFAITSPTAQEGKTSLATALALSFAGAHVKTLLVDLDVVGAGLSSRFEPLFRPRLGELLEQRGLVRSAQITEALAAAVRDGQKIGAALVKLNYVRESAVAQALVLQARPQPGVMDMVQGRALAESVLATRVEHLSILQLGAAHPEDGSHFSSSFIRRMLNEARQRFDVVLVDTGPVLGSVEAALVAPQVDATVLVVSRGTPRGPAAAAVTQLADLGAPVAGMVFNRAHTHEVRSYSQPSTRLHQRHGVPQPRLSPKLIQEAAAMGPLATAVALSMRSIHDPGEDAAPPSDPDAMAPQIAKPPGADPHETLTSASPLAAAALPMMSAAAALAIPFKSDAAPPGDEQAHHSDLNSAPVFVPVSPTPSGAASGPDNLLPSAAAPVDSVWEQPQADYPCDQDDFLPPHLRVPRHASSRRKRIRCFIARCTACRVKTAIRTDTCPQAAHCPKCHALMSVDPKPVRTVVVHCDGCGRRFVTPKRHDGSIHVRCPHCDRYVTRPAEM